MSAPLIGLDLIFAEGEERDRPDLARLMALRRQGVCSTMSPAVFFPRRGQSAAEAKVACRGCPVRGECVGYAVEHREVFGVWGGTTEKERRALNLLHVQGVPIEEIVAKVLAGDLDGAMASRRSSRRPTSRRRTMAPYGWRLSGGELAADQAEQTVLARLRSWARAGVPPFEAAARLNDDSIRTRRGEPWTAVKVVRVLDAPQQDATANGEAAATRRRAS